MILLTKIKFDTNGFNMMMKSNFSIPRATLLHFPYRGMKQERRGRLDAATMSRAIQ
jgi:hypothetical protein